MITRFAPSPTGALHLGHAFSALTIWRIAGDHPVILRIEDVDSTRSRAAHIAGIYDDLHWLGLHWPTPVRLQSQHRPDYQQVLDNLAGRGLLYPCSCTRRQIIAAGAVPGTDGLVYPGTCRGRPMSDASPGDALRLNLDRALPGLALPPIQETGPLYPGNHGIDPQQLRVRHGDPVLRRSENGDIAYLLACTHDDAAQSVTHVIRGQDLWSQTPLQIVLQSLMGWPHPQYHHHDLIRDSTGKRLAKITKSQSLASLRDSGATPADIRTRLGFDRA